MNNNDTPPNRLSNFLSLSSPGAFGEKQNTAAVKFLRKINGIKNNNLNTLRLFIIVLLINVLALFTGLQQVQAQ